MFLTNAFIQLLAIDYKSILFTKDKNSADTKDEIICRVCTAVNKACIRFLGSVFQQIKSIPMGGNAGPDIGDLCRHCGTQIC